MSLGIKRKDWICILCTEKSWLSLLIKEVLTFVLFLSNRLKPGTVAYPRQKRIHTCVRAPTSLQPCIRTHTYRARTHNRKRIHLLESTRKRTNSRADAGNVRKIHARTLAQMYAYTCKHTRVRAQCTHTPCYNIC